jgi:hypothetical protein
MIRTVTMLAKSATGAWEALMEIPVLNEDKPKYSGGFRLRM